MRRIDFVLVVRRRESASASLATQQHQRQLRKFFLRKP